MKKKVAVVTATRAEYGILRPFIQKLFSDNIVDLQLIVTGSHLDETYGNTQKEIIQDGFAIFKKIPILEKGNTKYDISVTMANAIKEFALYFRDESPDMVVLLGDRTEILAISCAALNEHIPIAHLHGGEVTEGAVDDCVRHAVTKMSHLHFAANEQYRKRILQLGENPDHVFNVGALGVENVFHTALLSKEEVCRQVGIPIHQKFAVVTFHPVTLEPEENQKRQIRNLIEALKREKKYFYVITMANADSGGVYINQLLQAYSHDCANVVLVPSLGMVKYLSTVKYSEFVLGNSSSGIIEAPALGVPTIDIGARQKGRMMADTILHCGTEIDEIVQAIERIPEIERKVSYLYGNGHTSDNIANVIYDYVNRKADIIPKAFFDL